MPSPETIAAGPASGSITTRVTKKLESASATRGGVCGWRQSEELVTCIDEKTRDLVVDACAKFEGTCDSDDDCTSGGCGGELCFNPAQSDRISDCECVALPEAACGCVNGQCNWYE